MKISILLPYKENFSSKYAGAVSLFVKDTTINSKYKNATLEDLTRLGNTLSKMLETRYLKKYQKEKAIQIQERIYSKKIS